MLLREIIRIAVQAHVDQFTQVGALQDREAILQHHGRVAHEGRAAVEIAPQHVLPRSGVGDHPGRTEQRCQHQDQEEGAGHDRRGHAARDAQQEQAYRQGHHQVIQDHAEHEGHNQPQHLAQQE